MPKRVYQAWPGNNIFLFSGHLIFGPDAKSLIVTLLLITVPVITFCIFVARHLRHHFASQNAGYAILVVAILFTVYVLFLLLFTSSRDPGIIPRNSHPPEEVFVFPFASDASLQFPQSKEVMINGVPVKVKYCDTCKLYRPPRCSHCSICNNCIERFDHHCPWVGQCIALRNYRYFFMFVSSSTLLCIYVFSFSAFYIKVLMDQYQSTVWRAMKESPASVVLMGYCFIALWFVGGLTGFHLYLISRNQTTYENFRYKSDSRTNAYNRGCLNNFREVFCMDIEPSKNNFRAFIPEEATRPPGLHTPIETETDYDRRPKVEGDLEIGDDFLKISQRRNVDEIDVDIQSRGTNGPRRNRNSSEVDSLASVEHQAPTTRTETHHSSWRRKSGSWDIEPDILSSNPAIRSRPTR